MSNNIGLSTVPVIPGKWRTFAQDADGRTIAVGEPQSSQLAARGDLMVRHPELFGILHDRVIDTVSEEDHVDY